LVYAVCARANTKGESLTYDEARLILEGAGVPSGLADAIGLLLRDIDSARYGRSVLEKAEREKMLAQTHRLVKGVLR
jgi:hypothetical protein